MEVSMKTPLKPEFEAELDSLGIAFIDDETIDVYSCDDNFEEEFNKYLLEHGSKELIVAYTEREAALKKFEEERAAQGIRVDCR